MKIPAIVTAVLLGAFAPAAWADLILLPNLFASEYCTMRSYGVNHDEALEVAVRESAIDGTPVKVTINGKTYDADVIKANRAAMERCPQYF